MGLSVLGVFAWFSPDADTYGSNADAVPDGAGMLELDHAADPAIAAEKLIGATGAQPITAAIIKKFSQTVKNNEAQDTTRLIYTNQVQVGIPSIQPRIDLQIYTVVDTVNSTFKFRLNDDDTEAANDSASSFSYGHGNQYDLLIVTDGTDWVLYVDGVEEIRVAGTLKMHASGGTSLVALRAKGSDDSGNSSTRFGGYAPVRYDGASDMPDVSATVFAELTLNGESATYQDYVGGVGATHPDKDNVNDWESGSADESTSTDQMIAAIGLTKLQAYTTPTYTVVNDHVAVVIQVRDKAQSGSKFGSANLFVYDGSNITHAANTVPLSTWMSYRRMFQFAPDGSTTWKNFSGWADLELGHKTVTDPDENEEAVEITAIQGEILDLAVVVRATYPGARALVGVI